VTSPPYFGLRDYGVAAQIGLEPTPDAYVAALVTVFREVRRVLKDDGTAWLNLGDSYASGDMTNRECAGERSGGTLNGRRGHADNVALAQRRCLAPVGLAPKNLVGIPWRVAFALQADGWYLRSDIIWSKPNPMPESVTDRPTKAHEYLFLLAKSERYHYDAAAIAERSLYPDDNRKARQSLADYQAQSNDTARLRTVVNPQGARTYPERNKRSVWTVATMPYGDAHFATFPEKLIEPCILAGCPLGGLVLDPFLGSGTVGAVAERLGRRWVGCDLNAAYHRLAQRRTAQRGLMWADGDAAQLVMEDD
jgi:DNA modification methylase